MFAAKSLARAPETIEVTLISRTNYHLFQPLLYQVATGILSEGQIARATRDVLKKKSVSVELAEVTGFDLEAHYVTTVRPGGRLVHLSYDSLIVAAGAGQSYFGHDEFSAWAPGMKTLADALSHRARIFGAFEMAELENDPENRRAWLTFTVVGGGPTGVEIAGQNAELSRRSLKYEFRRFDTAEVRVLLFEGGRGTQDRRRDLFEFDRYAHRRGRSRCEGARRVSASLFLEDQDLGCRGLGIALGEDNWRRRPALSRIGLVASKWNRTVRCPDTRRCSQ